MDFSIQAADFYNSMEIQIQKECVDWIAINKGAVGVRVNGVYLKPYPPGHPELSGEFFSPGSNEDEFFVGHLTAQFDAGAGAWLQLVQRFWVRKMQ